MMESEVTGNCHASFGKRDGETRRVRTRKVRAVPTSLSPVLCNLVLNGLETVLKREHLTTRQRQAGLINFVRWADGTPRAIAL